MNWALWTAAACLAFGVGGGIAYSQLMPGTVDDYGNLIGGVFFIALGVTLAVIFGIIGVAIRLWF